MSVMKLKVVLGHPLDLICQNNQSSTCFTTHTSEIDAAKILDLKKRYKVQLYVFFRVIKLG